MDPAAGPGRCRRMKKSKRIYSEIRFSCPYRDPGNNCLAVRIEDEGYLANCSHLECYRVKELREEGE